MCKEIAVMAAPLDGFPILPALLGTRYDPARESQWISQAIGSGTFTTFNEFPARPPNGRCRLCFLDLPGGNVEDQLGGLGEVPRALGAWSYRVAARHKPSHAPCLAAIACQPFERLGLVRKAGNMLFLSV